jgi:hypothetical protein
MAFQGAAVDIRRTVPGVFPLIYMTDLFDIMIRNSGGRFAWHRFWEMVCLLQS